MEFTEIYKCLSDASRLRILNLLCAGPLCGCHFMEALGLDQVKISKQLNYMKRLGILSAEREANWMIYQLVEPVSPLLLDNLGSLRRCAGDELPFEEDNDRLAAIMKRLSMTENPCPPSVAKHALATACRS